MIWIKSLILAIGDFLFQYTGEDLWYSESRPVFTTQELERIEHGLF